MKIHVWLIGILTLVGFVYGDTNTPAFQVATNQVDFERLIRVNAERTKRGEAPFPIQFTHQLDEQLVAIGTLPPVGDNSLVSLRFKNTPLEYVTALYAKCIGKDVVVDKGVSAAITFAVDKPVEKAEAAARIEKALADAGLVITPMGTNTVRISQQTK